MCRCCARRIAHARIVSIDTSAAEAMDGVEGVITSADVPGEDGFGVFVNDQPIMARGKVRYVGEAMAAVAAEDLLTAKRAVAAIKVVYEPLPAVFDADEAMQPGAPVVHDYAPGQHHQAHPDPRRRRRGGLCRVRSGDRGDTIRRRRSSTPISSRKRGSPTSTTTTW